DVPSPGRRALGLSAGRTQPLADTAAGTPRRTLAGPLASRACARGPDRRVTLGSAAGTGRACLNASFAPVVPRPAARHALGRIRREPPRPPAPGGRARLRAPRGSPDGHPIGVHGTPAACPASLLLTISFDYLPAQAVARPLFLHEHARGGGGHDLDELLDARALRDGVGQGTVAKRLLRLTLTGQPAGLNPLPLPARPRGPGGPRPAAEGGRPAP